VIQLRSGRGVLAKLLGSAILTQALLSATNLGVGLILLRHSTDLQYGYYVLMQSSILLLCVAQGSFIQPQLVTRMHSTDAAGRAALIGGLFREQRRLWPLAAALIAAVTLVLRLAGKLDSATALVVLAGGAAGIATLYREFFRMVLLGHRRPVDVLRGDSVYATLVIGGVLIATMTAAPAAVTGLTLALAAVTSGSLAAWALWRFERWNIQGSPGILRAFVPLGSWSTAGASVHWVVSQGYSYLVAGILSVPAVTAIAATRLTIMPVNLLSSGVGTVMLPTIADWLNHHGTSKVLRRTLAFTLLLSILALCYFTVVWLLRDWIFTQMLHKQIAQRDSLLPLWFAIGLAMVVRDQLIYIPTVRHRFRQLTTLSSANALVALCATYAGLANLGVTGALWGLLIGETLNVCGLILLLALELQQRFARAS
jgi:O-antigen/teichoic acid export membrane protein